MSKKIAFVIVGSAIIFIIFSVLPFLADTYAQIPDFVGI
jgi:xanthine/uracil permease